MLTLDPSDLEVTLGCFVAMHAYFGLGPIRHGAAFETFPFFFGAGGVCPLRILSGGCSFVIMLIEALVTASACALGMIHARRLCHFFL